MISATEIIGDGAPRCGRWTSTCLPCDSTWIGDAAHFCENVVGWRRDFWIQRLRAAMPAASRDELAALIDKPISRAELTRRLGDRWKVENDPKPNATAPISWSPRRSYVKSTWDTAKALDMVAWIEAHRHIYDDKPPDEKCVDCGTTDDLMTFGLPGSSCRDYRRCVSCAEASR